MATDITIYIEKFTPEQEWKFVGADDDLLGQFLKRNYILYGILANEESDYEFINDNETRGVIPIVPPRGIPIDCDKNESYSKIKFKKDPYNRWYPSWVTLKEILDYKYWDTFLCYELEIKIGDYKKDVLSIKNHSIIEVRNSKGKKVNKQEFRKLLESTNENSDVGYATVKIMIKEKYKERCNEFLNEFIPKLKELSNDYSKIRLVYEFW